MQQTTRGLPYGSSDSGISARPPGLQFVSVPNLAEDTLRRSGIVRRMRVLELECGAGDASLSIARLIAPSGLIVGVDRSEEAIDVAERRATGASCCYWTRFVIADPHTFVPRERFDVLVVRSASLLQGERVASRESPPTSVQTESSFSCPENVTSTGAQPAKKLGAAVQDFSASMTSCLPNGNNLGRFEMPNKIIVTIAIAARDRVTPDQVKAIQDSFRLVAPISEQAAALFYGRLFEIAPNVKPLFRGDMTEQGRKLIATLGVVVNSLDKLEAILPAASALAKRHVDYGVTAQDYTPVGAALLWTLEQGLGKGWTPELAQAWGAAYALLSDYMIGEAYSRSVAAE